MYDNLPLVKFEYPDSDTGHQKMRNVKVLTLDNAYLIGYELTNPHATDAGKYKKYCLSRIVQNGIHLVSFTSPPQT